MLEVHAFSYFSKTLLLKFLVQSGKPHKWMCRTEGFMDKGSKFVAIS